MPDWNAIIRQRIACLRLKPIAEAALIEEFAQHLDDKYRDLCSAGANPEDALREAVRELDDLRPVQEEFGGIDRMPRRDVIPIGDGSGSNLFEELARDLRFALRALTKSPLFALSVIATLSMGIGANTAVFTLINTLILNPLPLPHASDLRTLVRADAKNTAKTTAPMRLSYPDLRDYQTSNVAFAELAGYTSPQVLTLLNGQVSERMFGELVTGNYFSALGVRPARGRFFSSQEDTPQGDYLTAVLNYGSWQSRFGGVANIVGAKVRLNNLEFTIIGVAPPHFIGVNAVFGPDLWIPASAMEQLLPNEMRNGLSDRKKAEFFGIGRLRSGISPAYAQANISALSTELARAYPDADQDHTVFIRTVTDVLFGSSFGGSAAIIFAAGVLLAVVGIVLLIACSNVANLLLARSATRQHEFAVRLAAGASRPRLFRQLLTESALLGVLSGTAGVAIAWGGLRLLWSALPSTSNFVNPKLDGLVLLFAILVSLATGFVFGTLPALRASRADIAEILKQESHTASRNPHKISLGNVLLTGQVALSFLLLMTSALFLRSIQRAYEIDPGFQTARLAIFMTNPGQAGYNRTGTKAFYKTVRERVSTIPGIVSVSWSSNLPLWARPIVGLQIPGHAPTSKSESISTILSTVDRDFFETAGIAIEQGRAFTELDRETSAAVAIVNGKLARDYFPNGDALGKRIQLPNEKTSRQIIGIARVANYSTLAEAPQHCVYLPLEQNYSDAMTLYVRTQRDPRQILIPVQQTIRGIAPRIYANDIRTGSQIVDNGLFQAKIGVILLGVFGLLALALASIGLYGIVAWSTNQRTREIGLRIALGAAHATVVGMIVKQGMRLVIKGMLIGLGVALLADRWLRGILYGVNPGDPASIAGAALVLLAVAVLACSLPAYRASRINPVGALREG